MVYGHRNNSTNRRALPCSKYTPGILHLLCRVMSLQAGTTVTLQWRHNRHDGVSNHQPHDCLLNRLYLMTSSCTLRGTSHRINWIHDQSLLIEASYSITRTQCSGTQLQSIRPLGRALLPNATDKLNKMPFMLQTSPIWLCLINPQIYISLQWKHKS